MVVGDKPSHVPAQVSGRFFAHSYRTPTNGHLFTLWPPQLTTHQTSTVRDGKEQRLRILSALSRLQLSFKTILTSTHCEVRRFVSRTYRQTQLSSLLILSRTSRSLLRKCSVGSLLSSDRNKLRNAKETRQKHKTLGQNAEPRSIRHFFALLKCGHECIRALTTSLCCER